MTKKNKHIKRPQNIFNIAWISLLIVSIILVVSVDNLMNAFFEERFSLSRETELTSLGTKLAGSIERLTNQIRTYVVTLDPVDLQKYWYEIDVRQTREQVLDRLRILKASKKEIEYLHLAKRKSDLLHEKEIRGMKLILTLFEVPTEHMHPAIKAYELKLDDLNLDTNEQVNKAREIMFNDKYDEARKHIFLPILQYQNEIKNRMFLETSAARNLTNRMLVYVIILSTLILLLVIGIIWVRHISHEML